MIDHHSHRRNFSSYKITIRLDSSAGRVLHRYCKGHFRPEFFSGFHFTAMYNCHDQSYLQMHVIFCSYCLKQHNWIITFLLIYFRIKITAFFQTNLPRNMRTRSLQFSFLNPLMITVQLENVLYVQHSKPWPS